MDACELKRNVRLALVFVEARTKLLICQRSERLNMKSIAMPAATSKRRSSKAAVASMSGDSRRASRRLTKQSVTVDGMPSAQLMNDIKLQRELDTLIGIYTLAARSAQNDEDEDVQGHRYVSVQAAIFALRDDDARNDGGEDALEHELHQNQIRLQQLKTQLDGERTAAEERRTRQEQRSAELRDQLRNIKQLNTLEVSLVERWEVNRQTQACIVSDNTERRLLRQIIEVKRRDDAERRIICELMAYRNKQLAELRDQLAVWQRRYADETTHWLAQLAAQAERGRVLCKQRERHQETYDKRVEFVRIYREHEAEEQRLLELQQHRVASAVRIQAWWRGTMVRRGLGPYKKKSKKGKKSKNKAAK